MILVRFGDNVGTIWGHVLDHLGGHALEVVFGLFSHLVVHRFSKNGPPPITNIRVKGRTDY